MQSSGFGPTSANAASIQEQICRLLQQTLDPREQKNAEKALKSIEESQPKFVLDLVHILFSPSLPQDIRLVASIYLKNHIKNYWTDETSTKITDLELRNQIKELLIVLLVQSFLPLNVQRILTEVIVHIAFFDFPHLWPQLLPSLIGNLSIDNVARSNTVLGCLNAIFKKYRHEVRSDELFLEIKHVLETFAPVLSQLFKMYDSQYDQLICTSNFDPNRISAIEAILTGLILLNRIFYSLNWQDLPEYFEDEMKSFVQFFQKYLTSLTYPPSLVKVLTDRASYEQSSIDKLKTFVITNINLYAFKYSEDFPYIDSFVSLVWNIIGESGEDSRNDFLVSESMGFLEVVSKQFCNKGLFEDPSSLKELVDRVIVKNILLRDCDVELFEDEPLEWIRKDVEGTSHEGSRRSAATALIRGLMTFHQSALLPMLFEHVTKFMQINMDVSQCWKFKDASIFLFTAIAGSTGSTLSSRGVFSQINPLIKERLDQFYSDYVLIDLEGSSGKNSLVIVDCISFLTTFRSFLSSHLIIRSFPLVISLLNHSNEAVRNACYICIDKLLAIGGLDSYKPTWQYLASKDNLTVTLHQTIPILVTHLTSLISYGNYQKLVSNDFLLKAILRLIIIGKSDLIQWFDSILKIQNQILLQIITNPSHPKFNHFLFESISFLVKYCCFNNQDTYQIAERLLFPTIQIVLRDDVTEFVPYVFQLLSLLLYLIPLEQLTSTNSGFCQLLTHVIHPSIWSIPTNISALVKFLFTFILRYPTFVSNNYINQIMGIIQMLLKSKNNDLNGLLLWNCLVKNLPFSQIEPFLKPMTVLVLTKLQSPSKSIRSTRIATLFTANLIVNIANENSAQVWFALMESIQVGITGSFITGVLIKDALMLVDQDEKLLLFFTLAKITPLVPTLTCELVFCMAGLVQVSPHLTDPIIDNLNELEQEINDQSTTNAIDEADQESGVTGTSLASSSSKLASTSLIGSSMLYRLTSTRKSQLLSQTGQVLDSSAVRQSLLTRFGANINASEISSVQQLFSLFGLAIN